MNAKISAGHITTLLKKAGFESARWNRQSERVLSTGFISSLEESQGESYVCVTFEFSSWQQLSAELLAQTNEQIRKMSEALNIAGYIATIVPSYDQTFTYLKVRKAVNA